MASASSSLTVAPELLEPTVQLATDFRHDLHRHPELSGKEDRTAGRVSEMLSQAGIAHETNVGGTHGIVATLVGGRGPGRCFALRGDMDALPIQEENDVPYKSENQGVMHACGHDGHTANLLGATLILNQLRDRFAGTVKCIFQPAEETVRGADALVDAGVMDGVDAIVMLHGWPTLPPGQVGIRTGPVMASSDTFSVKITGKGGHGAYPHDTIDPIAIGAQVVTALQTIASREISPVSPVVVSVTQFHAGGPAKNVIPTVAEIGGTVRTLDPALRDQMAGKIERVVSGVCSALRATYEFSYRYGTPVTVNDASVADLIREVGREVVGPENVVELAEPTMGAEDFAYYLSKAPGAMFRLGTGCDYLLHTPKYDFGDAPLQAGIPMMVGLAIRFLSAG